MNPAPELTVPSALPLRAKNLLGSGVVVAGSCLVYAFAPHNDVQMGRLYGWAGFSFTGNEFLTRCAAVYLVLLFAYYFLERAPGPSKSVLVFRLLGRFVRAPKTTFRKGVSRQERVALLTTLLKGFFAPMMTMSLMVFLMSAIENGKALMGGQYLIGGAMALFDRYGFWFLIQIILFVDVLVFTVGYLVELPMLRNEIRSVDPTWLGWGAALICYPPFNVVTGKILGSPVSDFPRFDDPTAHLALNLALLTLMAIYASASVALGWKASNLTHRGIVSRGPYALVRHPAYICKNMAWWIGSIPLISAAFTTSVIAGLQAVASVVAWSMIYVLRALTEEDHLRSVDGEYAAYAARVRYRFIPGVY